MGQNLGALPQESWPTYHKNTPPAWLSRMENDWRSSESFPPLLGWSIQDWCLAHVAIPSIWPALDSNPRIRFKVRTFLDWELSGHHEIVQKLYYSCPRSREIAKILGGQSVVRHPVVCQIWLFSGNIKLVREAIRRRRDLQGVSQHFGHLVFLQFLGFWGTYSKVFAQFHDAQSKNVLTLNLSFKI